MAAGSSTQIGLPNEILAQQDQGAHHQKPSKWSIGFRRKLGLASNVLAELWGLRDGLSIALEHNFNNLKIEIDDETVLELLKSSHDHSRAYANIINDCRSILHPYIKCSLSTVIVKPTADFLANQGEGVVQQKSFYLLENIPPDLVCILNEDVREVAAPRMVYVID